MFATVRRADMFRHGQLSDLVTADRSSGSPVPNQQRYKFN